MQTKIPGGFFEADTVEKADAKNHKLLKETPDDVELVSGQIADCLVAADALGCAMFMSCAYRIRQTHLPERVNRLGETGWNILVETFIGNETGNKVSIADIACSGQLPFKTALRYSRLLEHSLLVDHVENSDSEHVYLKMTEKGQAVVSGILSRILNASQ